jgi:hypothetical protein
MPKTENKIIKRGSPGGFPTGVGDRPSTTGSIPRPKGGSGILTDKESPGEFPEGVGEITKKGGGKSSMPAKSAGYPQDLVKSTSPYKDRAKAQLKGGSGILGSGTPGAFPRGRGEITEASNHQQPGAGGSRRASNKPSNLDAYGVMSKGTMTERLGKAFGPSKRQPNLSSLGRKQGQAKTNPNAIK